MRERLQAEEALHHIHLATLSSQYCDKGYREGVLKRWQILAYGYGADEERDEQGRLVLHTGQQMRDWMVTMGGFRREEL